MSIKNEKKIVDKIIANRLKTSSSIMQFHFDSRRVKTLTETSEISKTCKGILYWTVRDQRVQDNWSMLYAQKLALKMKIPLYMCVCLVPKFLAATIRQFDFMLKGLKEVNNECKNLNIQFHLLLGKAAKVLPKFINTYGIGAIIIDFFPLKIFTEWVINVKQSLPKHIPIFQVDAHNIVPCWIASDKLEYAARTIRKKINSKLKDFLTEFPPVIYHPYSSTIPSTFEINWDIAYKTLKVDRTIKPVTWAISGTYYGLLMLNDFCVNRLENYVNKKNDPNANMISNLSPWIHFGQLSAQRVVLQVSYYKDKYPKSVDAFLEELIIRKELSDNFCFYNNNYDNLQGAKTWAINTLNDHRNDVRSHIYSLYELEKALTHDDLWNASQVQMVIHGKMHGYLRMYWAKKILEWTKNPEEALSIAMYLNDKYFIDGRDPNGYVGCMWSICGIHDHGWKERPIFGKIRYMSYDGCKKKFNVPAFVAKWNIKI